MARYPEVRFFQIRARGIERRLSLASALALGENAVGIIQAGAIVRRFRPCLILGTGGYASFAPLAWGIARGIPTMIHEQNVVPGLVNRLLAPWVDRVLLTYEETAHRLRAPQPVVTGLPLRPSILAARALTREEAKRACGLDPRRPVTLALGGSHGAQVIHDELLRESRHLIGCDVQLAIVAGWDAKRLRAAVSGDAGAEIRILEHTSAIGRLMRAADVTVTRAGGATLAELLALEVPSIVIPWPDAAGHHQELNARWLAARGACRLLTQDRLVGTRLVDEILTLLQDESQRRTLARRCTALAAPDAHQHVLREVERYLHHERHPRSLSLHRHRRRWDERARLDALRARAPGERLGSA